MNKENIYKQVEECLLEDMDSELLLYNPNNATTLHLNSSSAVVWQLCTGERSVQNMIDVVQEAYPDQSAQVEGDIVDVLTDFIKQECLVQVGLEEAGLEGDQR